MKTSWEGVRGRVRYQEGTTMKLKTTNADRKTFQKLQEAIQAARIENPAKWIEQERKRLSALRQGRSEAFA